MRIVICGLLKYPAGDAGSVRQEKLAQLLMHMHHEVFVVGLGPANNGAVATCNGISYVSFREPSAGLPSKVKTHVLYRWARVG